MPPEVTIAAPILSRTPEDSEFLLRSVERLALHGPVMLADGGSIDGFVARLAEIPGVTVQATPGTGSRLLDQVRQAILMASESESRSILYTEPDKKWFFESRLATFLKARKPKDPNPGIYFPARNAVSFRTFPVGQQSPERLFNTLAAETLGISTDFLYGPLLLRRELIPYLADLPAGVGWGWRIYILTIAARLNLSLVPWEADLPCPPEQRDEDDEKSRTYRIEQMAQNVRGLALGRKYSLTSEPE